MKHLHPKMRLVPPKPPAPTSRESWWVNLDHVALNAEAHRRFQGQLDTFRAGPRPVYAGNEEAVMNFLRKA